MKLIRTLLIILVACAPATSPAADSIEQQMSALLTDWGNALIKRDMVFLEKVLAAEFKGVDELGAIFTREQYLTTMKSEDQVVKSFEFSELGARDYGEYAVLTVKHSGEASYKGKVEAGTYRTTLVFARREGRWQCVASHASVVAKQP